MQEESVFDSCFGIVKEGGMEGRKKGGVRKVQESEQNVGGLCSL